MLGESGIEEELDAMGILHIGGTVSKADPFSC